MTVIGCLQSIPGEPEEIRCALPEGHLGPHGAASSAALQPHSFEVDPDIAAAGCFLCQCLPSHVLHSPALAQSPDPEATDTPLRDKKEDPIERYLNILNPKQELPFTAGDPVQMAIATALLLGVKELKRIADALESLGTLYDEELDRQLDERMEGGE